MIGDLIINLNVFLKKLFCLHNYKPDRIGLITGLNNRRICTKCKKYE